MSGKIEYLEKYSVAPSPSRDYYGIKVLRDQVVLYLWKISHGPHKLPIVKTSDFADFEHDKSFQDEIRRGFGECLLKHVDNIASGKRNTLLTLPKSVLEKLVKYLTANDIVKLSSLSHVAKQVFDDNSVWEALYNKYKPLRTNKYDNLCIKTPNWKEMYQRAIMQGQIKEEKISRNRVTLKQSKTSTKIENTLQMQTSNFTSKAAPKIPPTVSQVSRKPSEHIRKKTNQNVSRKLSDNRLDNATKENEKIGSEKRISTGKSIQTIGQKNLKTMKERLLSTKNESKRETEIKNSSLGKIGDTKSSKGQNKVRRTESRASNSSTKMGDGNSSSGKLKTGQSTIVKKEKSHQVQGNEGKSKVKGKAKKIGQSKSSILRTSTNVAGMHSPIRDDSFNLADLIEASLKNIRSPRSIFDDDFSCIVREKSYVGDTSFGDDFRRYIEPTRRIKSKGTLDRLSERSEPPSAKSKASGTRSDRSQESTSDTIERVQLKKIESAKESNKNNYMKNVETSKANGFERYGIYDKYPIAGVKDSIEQERINSQHTMDKINKLRSLGLNDSTNVLTTLKRDVMSASRARRIAGNMSRDKRNINMQ